MHARSTRDGRDRGMSNESGLGERGEREGVMGRGFKIVWQISNRFVIFELIMPPVVAWQRCIPCRITRRRRHYLMIKIGVAIAPGSSTPMTHDGAFKLTACARRTSKRTSRMRQGIWIVAITLWRGALAGAISGPIFS
jgi:hypothetical protein